MFRTYAFWMAVLLLCQESPDEKARRLIDRLKSPDLSAREQASRELESMGKSIEPILQEAAKDPNPEVAARAKSILWTFTYASRITPKLRERVPGVEERLRAGQWFAVVSELVDEKGAIDPEFAWISIPALQHATEAYEKEWLLHFAVRFRVEGSAEVCEAMLKDEEPQIRKWAIWGLLELKKKESAPQIAERLEDDSPAVRQMAVSALGTLMAREQGSKLIDCIDDVDGGVRESAIHSLAILEVDAAKEKILLRLRDEYLSVRDTAAWALVRFQYREAIPTMIELLKDEFATVRQTVCRTLGVFGASEATPALAERLQDVDAMVRRDAAWALGRIGNPKSAEALAARLNDGDAEVRFFAAEALCRLGRGEGAVEALRPPEGRSPAYFAMNALGDPELWKKLSEAVVGSDKIGRGHRIVERLMKEAGVGFTLSESVRGSWAATSHEAVRIRKGTRLLFALEEALGGSVAIFQDSGMKIVSDGEAAEFWAAWLQKNEKE